MPCWRYTASRRDVGRPAGRTPHARTCRTRRVSTAPGWLAPSTHPSPSPPSRKRTPPACTILHDRDVTPVDQQQLECAHADPKGKVAQEDITLWGQPMYEVSQKHHFPFSFDYVRGGEFSTGNYILWHSPHCGMLIRSQQP